MRQYGRDIEAFPLTDSEWADLYQNIMLENETHPEMNVYEIVHDVVYEYMTK
nr:YqzH family protein [Anoxybacillus sp.]